MHSMRPWPQMVDEDPYELPSIDERQWFTGGHLGSQIQRCNWQVRRGAAVPAPACQRAEERRARGGPGRSSR